MSTLHTEVKKEYNQCVLLPLKIYINKKTSEVKSRNESLLSVSIWQFGTKSQKLINEVYKHQPSHLPLPR